MVCGNEYGLNIECQKGMSSGGWARWIHFIGFSGWKTQPHTVFHSIQKASDETYDKLFSIKYLRQHLHILLFNLKKYICLDTVNMLLDHLNRTGGGQECQEKRTRSDVCGNWYGKMLTIWMWIRIPYHYAIAVDVQLSWAANTSVANAKGCAQCTDCTIHNSWNDGLKWKLKLCTLMKCGEHQPPHVYPLYIHENRMYSVHKRAKGTIYYDA